MKNNIAGIIVCIIVIIVSAFFITQQVAGVALGTFLDMGDHQIKNMQDASDLKDAVTKSQINSITNIWTEGAGYIYYDGAAGNGRVGIGTGIPDARLNIGETTGATILLTREDTTTVTDELLGRILFESTDGNVSSVDAPAVIKAYATELFDATKKGGKLIFGVKAKGTGVGAAAVTKMEINEDGVRMILENRLTNPAAEVGQMWICTDAGGDCQ